MNPNNNSQPDDMSGIPAFSFMSPFMPPWMQPQRPAAAGPLIENVVPARVERALQFVKTMAQLALPIVAVIESSAIRSGISSAGLNAATNGVATAVRLVTVTATDWPRPTRALLTFSPIIMIEAGAT